MAPIVFGAAECRKYAAIPTRRGMQYWRDPARGEDRFPEPCQRINDGRTEVWDIDAVAQWVERTRERRGLVWVLGRGLVKRTEVEHGA